MLLFAKIILLIYMYFLESGAIYIEKKMCNVVEWKKKMSIDFNLNTIILE